MMRLTTLSHLSRVWDFWTVGVLNKPELGEHQDLWGAGAAGVLIVDEAERLSNTCFAQSRDLFDRTSIGVVLVGSPASISTCRNTYVLRLVRSAGPADSDHLFR